eukprot:SAG31_NODE_892_length_11180_cov_22.596426_5_plen_80_part_00
MAELDDNPEKINEMTSVVAFSPDEAGKAALLAAAKDIQAKAGGEIDDMKYCELSWTISNGTKGQEKSRAISVVIICHSV